MNKQTSASAEILSGEDGRTLILSGQLTFVNGKQVYQEFSRQLQDNVERVDCSRLEHADSCALALLLSAAGRAVTNGRSLRIEGLNPRLKSLAQVYGVDQLLGLNGD